MRILRRPEVEQKIGLRRSEIYRKLLAWDIPKTSEAVQQGCWLARNPRLMPGSSSAWLRARLEHGGRVNQSWHRKETDPVLGTPGLMIMIVRLLKRHLITK